MFSGAEVLQGRSLGSQIIEAAQCVSRELGWCLPAATYKEALRVELRARGIRVERDAGMVAKYLGRVVGDFSIDLLVDDRLVITVRAEPKLAKHDVEGARTLMRAARMPKGIILNFGTPRIDYRRLAVDL